MFQLNSITWYVPYILIVSTFIPERPGRINNLLDVYETYCMVLSMIYSIGISSIHSVIFWCEITNSNRWKGRTLLEFLAEDLLTSDLLTSWSTYSPPLFLTSARRLLVEVRNYEPFLIQPLLMKKETNINWICTFIRNL